MKDIKDGSETLRPPERKIRQKFNTRDVQHSVDLGNEYHYYYLSVSHGLTASLCNKAKKNRLFWKIHMTFRMGFMFILLILSTTGYFHILVILKISGLSNTKEFSRGSIVIMAPWSLQDTKGYSSEKEKWIYYVYILQWGESWSSIFDNYSFCVKWKEVPS